MARSSREITVGKVAIGGGAQVTVQTMCATHTREIDATVAQINEFEKAGADIVRLAVDSRNDALSLSEIRNQTSVTLSVDLQENYQLVAAVAPHVDKIRYNPGHLHHHEKTKPVKEKVKFLVAVAIENDCAIRIGVNCGSVEPDIAERYAGDKVGAMIASAHRHCEFMDQLGFTRYVVSLKDSHPKQVLAANRRFSALRSDVPLHLGVTEAGMPPEGITKARRALGPLLREGIGDTIRFSLTLPNERKNEEIIEGRRLLADVAAGAVDFPDELAGLNIISCPSCSRVENEAFIELAEHVRKMAAFAREHDITIAVMGCRVNGPGETDDADLGLWCGPKTVHLKRGQNQVGVYTYDDILEKLRVQLEDLIASKA